MLEVGCLAQNNIADVLAAGSLARPAIPLLCAHSLDESLGAVCNAFGNKEVGGKARGRIDGDCLCQLVHLFLLDMQVHAHEAE